MSSKHEVIKWKVITDWTTKGRGRIYCMNQGMAVPLGSDHPIWFGPLKRKFKGFPDLFGFQDLNIGFDGDGQELRVPWFTVIEVKTAGDRVKPRQRAFLDWAISQGIRAYVAWEADNDDGYELKEWGG